MKSIYILLSKSDTYISKIIKFATDDQYTHASISFSDNLEPLYSFARLQADRPLPAGLCTESFHNGFFKKFQYIPCALYELKVEDDVYEATKADAEKMIEDAAIYRYSIMGLIFCMFSIPVNRRHHYFCSEFVSELLLKNNAITLPKPPSLMRPNDYTKIPHLSCIYEGQISGLAATKNRGID